MHASDARSGRAADLHSFATGTSTWGTETRYWIERRATATKQRSSSGKPTPGLVTQGQAFRMDASIMERISPLNRVVTLCKIWRLHVAVACSVCMGYPLPHCDSEVRLVGYLTNVMMQLPREAARERRVSHTACCTKHVSIVERGVASPATDAARP